MVTGIESFKRDIEQPAGDRYRCSKAGSGNAAQRGELHQPVKFKMERGET